MAFDNSFTAVVGATYTAAQYNTYTKGNFTSIWVGTTAGDIDYYTSSTAKNRVAIGTLGALLKSTGSAPSWLTRGSAYSVLNVNAGGTDIEWGYQRTKFCLVTNSGTQTIPATGSALNILWNTDTFDDDGWHSTVSNTERIIPTVSGVYKASVMMQIQNGGAVNAFFIRILKNNTDVIGYFRNTTEANFQVNRSAFSIPVTMNGTTDYINVTVEQNNAGTLTMAANPYLTVERLR